MDHIKQGHRLIRLVRLQLADKVQVDAGMRLAQGWPLGLSLLHPVLTKHPLTRFDQRRNVLSGVGFADRDQRDLFGAALRN